MRTARTITRRIRESRARQNAVSMRCRIWAASRIGSMILAGDGQKWTYNASGDAD
jgi:hypothetical protein